MTDTCRDCSSRLARKIEASVISVLCEYDGWILPIRMDQCQHMRAQVRRKRTADDYYGDDLPDAEAMR